MLAKGMLRTLTLTKKEPKLYELKFRKFNFRRERGNEGTRRRGDKVARRQEINFLIVTKLTIIVCIVFLVNLSTGPLSTKKLILINLKH